MAATSSKQGELFDKLVVLANGNVELVKRAIWASSKDGKSANLSDIIEYIQKYARQQEKIPA